MPCSFPAASGSGIGSSISLSEAPIASSALGCSADRAREGATAAALSEGPASAEEGKVLDAEDGEAEAGIPLLCTWGARVWRCCSLHLTNCCRCSGLPHRTPCLLNSASNADSAESFPCSGIADQSNEWSRFRDWNQSFEESWKGNFFISSFCMIHCWVNSPGKISSLDQDQGSICRERVGHLFERRTLKLEPGSLLFSSKLTKALCPTLYILSLVFRTTCDDNSASCLTYPSSDRLRRNSPREMISSLGIIF